MSRKILQVTLNIINHCSDFIGEPLHLAGTFNNWNPEHLRIAEVPPKGKSLKYILKDVPAGDLELKLTRGNWDTLEANVEGKLKKPQIFKVQNDTEITLEIDSWRDLYPKSTASKQVYTLDDHFFFPELNVYRKVMIYLPKDYHTGQKHYPVIYMHDGQHLFDEARSIGRAGPIEWMVDEYLDDSDSPSIIVAVDHAKNYELRQQEYLVHPAYETKSALGWSYLEDIVHSLKPYVDNNYRTLTDPAHTAMVGSSLAALLSIYAGLKYPNIFGCIAAFSPSIWMDETNLYQYSEALFKAIPDRTKQDFYFYIGDRERRFRIMDAHNNMKLDMDKYYAWLKSKFNGKLSLHINPEGKHGAFYWQTAFQEFYHYWKSNINSII